MSFGVLGAQAQRLAIVALSLLQPAHVFKQDGQVVVRLRIVGAQSQRIAIVSLRLWQLAATVQEPGVSVVCLDVFGAQPECLPIMLGGARWAWQA